MHKLPIHHDGRKFGDLQSVIVGESERRKISVSSSCSRKDSLVPVIKLTIKNMICAIVIQGNELTQ